MGRRAFIAIVVVAIAVVSVAIFFLLQVPVYSDNPQDWLRTTPEGEKVIDVKTVTKGIGDYAFSSLYLEDERIDVVFYYDGLYEGDSFVNNIYLDDDDNVMMTITPKMDPTNGILEGTIIHRLEPDNSIKAFIFLDEDWRKKLGNTINILWGWYYENERPFQFNEISPGIYMDQIVDDRERFADDLSHSFGGIAVGNAHTDDAIEENTDDITVMRIF